VQALLSTTRFSMLAVQQASLLVACFSAAAYVVLPPASCPLGCMLTVCEWTTFGISTIALRSNAVQCYALQCNAMRCCAVLLCMQAT
jgi:hypothetical protein